VFSGSFWWHTPARTPQGVQRNRILHRQVRRSKQPPRLRLWFEAGTLDETDDRDGNGVIDSIQDTTELMDELALKGYRPGIDMVYRQVEGGKHDLPTWAAVLPEFLTWAFPPQPERSL
jgi:enterochelin esterase-like enzyme